jgi:iron complex outermembrane receptor protein
VQKRLDIQTRNIYKGKMILNKYSDITIFILLLFIPHLKAQQMSVDSTDVRTDTLISTLPEIQVTGYLDRQLYWETPASVSLLTTTQIEMQAPSSMVGAFNTLPGIRMEERSPGSYRLSIRNSLVRSPYGVRNVKVYYNEFPFTDAGGNTYLNALNMNDLQGIEVLKGPDGSLFGANSGGVVFLKSDVENNDKTQLNTYAGSFGTVGDNLSVSGNAGNHFISLKQSWQRSDGYRQNTQNNKFFSQLSDNWNYSKKGFLDIYAFFSDISYRTPGGLTLEQFNENPEQARPATSRLPGAQEQKTGSHNVMYFVGLRNKIAVNSMLSNTSSAWGNFVDYTNRAITNYEKRKEDNWGFRSYFTLKNADTISEKLRWSTNAGMEWQRLSSDIHNFDNKAGIAGNLQAYSDILTTQYFWFVKGRVEWKHRIIFEAALSYNYYSYHFKDTTHIKNNFKPVAMPHFACNYRLNDLLLFRFTLSKGYSPPTTAEVRPANNKIYSSLKAEYGWNREIGARLFAFNNALIIDASAYSTKMRDGIVTQIDENGTSFFVNSGKTDQTGAEISYSCLFSLPIPFIENVKWSGAYTYSHYKYKDYRTEDGDYSGNNVPGIPRHVLTNSLAIQLKSSFHFSAQYTFNDKTPLDDANTLFSKAYHLLQVRGSKTFWTRKMNSLEIYGGIDNLLNRKYSLGNDINAYGGRYYNAAPARNYYIGLKINI